MATSAKIFRINYKSDFILTLTSDAGWMTPFCIKFWTGAPSQAYYVGWDGETYNHCSFDPSEPTKLQVQFDDHHLPIGDLKYQVAYHFTVADFPNDTEDEVINPANITTEIDGETYQVMLDFTGETAPEIQFALPAYANEAQRIANEQQRIAAETQRIANEETRIANEQTRINQEQTRQQNEQQRINQEQARQQNEQQRINQEQARVNEFATLKSQSQAATSAANTAATLANEKAQLAADKAALADAAATLANQKAQLAADKAALANAAAQLANEKAALAQQKADYAQTQGDYAKTQGDYAKEQGEIAEEDHERAEADHTRAESDHATAGNDHTQAGTDHTRAESDHATAAADHTQAGQDHTTAASDHGIAAEDHTQAGTDHTRAESDHGIAANDHTQAGNDHTRAESDHTRAESDHASVEVYVDSLGAFDISAYHATGGVLAKYADLTAALGTNGANIPDALRKGGMSVKFVLTSDNKYRQFLYLGTAVTGTPNPFLDIANWQGIDDEPTAKSENLVKSGGVYTANLKAMSKFIGEENAAKTSFRYLNLSLIPGHLYYVKSISGFVGTIRSNNTDAVALVKDEWVAFTPVNATGFYNYTNPTTGKETPVILVADSDGVINETNAIRNTLEQEYISDDSNAAKTNKSILLWNQNSKLVYEQDSTGIYITDIIIYTRGGISLSINNLGYLKTALDQQDWDIAPSGVNSIKIASGYKLVYRYTTLSIQSANNCRMNERVLLFVDNSGSLNGGELFLQIKLKTLEEKFPVTTSDLSDGVVTEPKMSPELIQKLSGVVRHTFVFAATTGTYLTKYLNMSFVNGHRYQLSITYPDGFSGQTYFSVRAANGSSSVLQNQILVGTASREGEFTCNVTGGESWCLTVKPAHEDELSFSCTLVDLDAASIESNRMLIDELMNETNPSSVITINGKHYIDNMIAQSKRAARYKSGGTAQVGENQLVLLHFSDIHGDAVNTARIMEFFDNYASDIDSVICTGDMIADKWEDDMDWWHTVGADDVMVVIGNHDVQTTGTAITSKQAYDRYIAPYVSGWGVTQPTGAAANGYNYYYKDYTSAKMRLICLDCMFWDSTQKTWLEGVLASAKTNGYAVICAQHYPFGTQTPVNTGFNSLMPRVADMSNTSALTAVQDFIDGGGEFVCWMVGHEHSDYFGTIQDYPDQLVITIANASKSSYWDDTARVEGQKSQDCFNIISFDYYQKMLKIFRVGADYDRLLRHKGSLCYDYANRQLIFSE